ncbi:O-antigen polysaccharide polymerase Wzy [Vibrio cyclitrophicus]
MLESLYLLSLLVVLLVLKAHPTSLIFVAFTNCLTGFTPIVTTLVKYDGLVEFDKGFVLSLVLIFNFSISIFHMLYVYFKVKHVRFFVFGKYKYSRVILYLFSFFAVLVVFQNINQGIEVISHGYISGYKDASEQSFKSTSFFPFLLIFNFLLFIYYLRSKNKVYLILMGFIIASYLMYGSRSFLLYTAISIVAFLILMKKITYTKFALVSLLFLPFIVIAGALREGGTAVDSSLLFRMALEMANIPMIISNLDALDSLNQPFIVILLSALPHSIIVPLGVEPINSLSTEFVTSYDPGWAKTGGGFGFSIIGEIYYRFGYLGLIVVPYIIVQFLHNIEEMFLEGDEFDKALMLTCFYGMLMWPRGDFIEISRLLMIVFFFYYSKRLVYRNGK